MCSHKCTSLASWICLANLIQNAVCKKSWFLHKILFPCAHIVKVLVCSKHIFLTFQPLTCYHLSLQVRGLWLMFFQSPLTSLPRWITEQTRCPEHWLHPVHSSHELRNMLSLGSVLYSGYGKASHHLPKVHTTDNKDPCCTLVYSPQLKRYHRWTTGKILG